MPNAKVINMRARPLQASHLCFQVGGIVEQLNVALGQRVTPFDFATFYGNLGELATGFLGRLHYDSNGIQNDKSVQASTLVTLRAEPTGALLDKAVNARQNAYFAKYANVPTTVAKMQQYFGDLFSPDSKQYHLGWLQNISNFQRANIRGAYIAVKRDGVVKTTSSILDSVTRSSESSSRTGQSNEEEMNAPGVVGPLPPLPPGGLPFPGGTGFGEPTTDTLLEATSGDTSQSSGVASECQTIVNTDYGYRMPSAECEAQFHRAQASLADETFAAYMQSQNVPYLDQVFQNELQSIDLDVKRLQIAYLNTILMSPIDGVVTGVYKSLGDCVTAGEPVIRVEDNQTVLLAGTLKYRGLISTLSTATVQTSLFDSSGPKTSVTGSVVAARGRQYADDQWEIVISCNNIDGSGNSIFPLGYNFDYDDTVVTIT